MSTHAVQRPDQMAYSEKNALDNLNTSQDTQAECKLLNAIRKSNPEFVDEITALAQNAIDIEKSMKAIDRFFLQMQLGDVSHKSRVDVQNLRNIWSGHITTYTKLLWGPHKTPGFTQGFEGVFAHDFFTSLLDNTAHIYEKQLEITKYQQNIQGDASQVESESMAQGLFALQEDIQVIQQQWTDVVDRYSLGSLQSQGVQAENVSALTATLQSINERVNTFASSLGTYHSTKLSGPGVADVHGVLFPVLWPNALLAVIGSEAQHIYDRSMPLPITAQYGSQTGGKPARTPRGRDVVPCFIV